MKYRIIPWTPQYSHIPIETTIQGVCRLRISKYPQRFFKHVFLDTKRNIMNMLYTQFHRTPMKLPACIIAYEIDDDPNNTKMQADYPYQYPAHYIAGRLSDHYQRVYFNPENKIEIFTGYVRKKIQITLKYLFSDIRERDDVYVWMLNNFRYKGAPEELGNKLAIFSPIPQTLIEYLAVCENKDINDENAMNTLNSELATYSSGIFRLKKITMGEDKSMWTMVYRQPWMQIFAEDKPQKDDGETLGQLHTKFGITETIVIEPHFPQVFITKVPELINSKITPAMYKPATLGSMSGYDSRLLRCRELELDSTLMDLDFGRWGVISNTEFGVEKAGTEEIDMDYYLFPANHRMVLRKVLNGKFNPDDYYRVYVYKFDKKLPQSTYTVDWEHLRISIKNTKPTDIYRLAIVQNKLLVYNIEKTSPKK